MEKKQLAMEVSVLQNLAIPRFVEISLLPNPFFIWGEKILPIGEREGGVILIYFLR